MQDIYELLSGIERPSRYIGGEFGLPGKPPQNPRLRLALGFPDVYEVGMSHLGFRLLHSALAGRSDLQTERFFLPWPDLQRRLVQQNVPLFTLESHLPLKELDLLGISLQYELAIPAVLRLLDLAQIPRRVAARAAQPGRYPLVLVGGAGALNPEPLVPFVDAFFVGEADQGLPQLVELLAELKGAERPVLLEALSQLPGLYLPELTEIQLADDGLGARVSARAPLTLPVERQYVADLNNLPPPAVQLVPLCAPVHDRVAVEIQRGCSHGCRFCQAGFVTRPTRQRAAEQILELAEQQLAATGYQDLALLSLSAGDHPALQPLLAQLIERLVRQRIAISLPSLRTESLHPLVAEYVTKVRKTGFTLAPEAGTERLRQVINKGNTEENLLASIRSVQAAGYHQIKLYFMIGLPTETEQDVLAIAKLAERALAALRGGRRAPQLTVSVSTFVPKPHTPFQWEAAPDLAQIRAKQQLLQKRLPRRIRLKWHDPGQSIIEALLARGDRRLAGVLERVVTPDYLGRDAWSDGFELPRWQAALEAAELAGELPPLQQLLGPRDPAAPLPWEAISVGVERRYLLAERQAAYAGSSRPSCQDGSCDACGVCPDEPLHVLAEPLALPSTPSLPSPPATAQPATEELAAQSPQAAVFAAAPAAQPAAPSVVRIWFEKRGRASQLAHLEMVGAFERAARRAALPLFFSAGYHPKPKLRFSPALPLGAESCCEFLELALSEPLAAADLGQRLAAQLPEGLVLGRCEPAGASLLPAICGMRWRFSLPAPPLTPLGDRWQGLQAGSLLVQRKGKTLDLAQLLADFALLDPQTFELSCRLEAEGTVRPRELLTALLALDEGDLSRVRIMRVGWKTRSQKPPAELSPQD